MVIGTYNGVNIITTPVAPVWRQMQWSFFDTVAQSRSIYTGATQVQAWPGADSLSCEVTLPQVTQGIAQQWQAFLAECRGIQNVFYLSDPLHAVPVGTPKGNPVLSGVNSSMSQVVNTRGWTPNTIGHLMPGDHLQIGYHLHYAVYRVDSDANGNAAITVWPSVREATADGDPLTLNNPQGLFRLAENKRSILTTETRLSGISLKCIEAR